MSFPKASLFPYTAEVNSQGHLVLGGCDVVDLAREFGTPLYIFDEVTLRSKAREFKEEFGLRYPQTRVIYACKAFINTALARLFKEEGLGLDVVSGGELAVAQAAEFPPALIYFHGNNKSAQELAMALDYGVGRIVVDNFHELSLLNSLAQRMDKAPEILLRLSPGIDPHTHVYTTTGVVDSKFGFLMADDQAERALRQALASPSLRPIGLHFHLGSPIFEIEPYVEGLKVVLHFAARFREQGFELREISPGGGFAIAYTEEQRPPSVGQYAEAIAAALKEGCEAHGLPLPRLVVEPGRALVGQAGVALYTVGSTKEIPGLRKYVSVDGGMGDNIRPALYGAQYEVLVANKVLEAAREKVTIAGKFCESGDILIREALLPPLEAGDLLAIPAAGAYAPAMASHYNLVPRPAMVLVRDGRSRLIRRRETYQDLQTLDLE